MCDNCRPFNKRASILSRTHISDLPGASKLDTANDILSRMEHSILEMTDVVMSGLSDIHKHGQAMLEIHKDIASRLQAVAKSLQARERSFERPVAGRTLCDPCRCYDAYVVPCYG